MILWKIDEFMFYIQGLCLENISIFLDHKYTFDKFWMVSLIFHTIIKVAVFALGASVNKIK